MFSSSIPADGESKGKASAVTADFIVGPDPGWTRWLLGLGRKLKVELAHWAQHPEEAATLITGGGR